MDQVGSGRPVGQQAAALACRGCPATGCSNSGPLELHRGPAPSCCAMGDPVVPLFTAYSVPLAAALPSSQLLEGEYKAWKYNSGLVTWELRRPLQILFGEGQAAFEPHRMTRKDKGVWKTIFEQWGFDFEEHFLPSARSDSTTAQHAEQAGDAPPAAVAAGQQRQSAIRQETSVSTELLLVLHIFWASTRRSRESKERVEAMLVAFLTKLVPPQLMDKINLQGFLDASAAECDAQTPLGICMHMAGLHARCQKQPPQSSVHAHEKDKYLMLGAMVSQCPAAKLVGHAALAALADAVGHHIDVAGCPDVTKFAALHGAKKRRRVDEDYKHHLTAVAVNTGRASTAAAAASARGEAESSSRRWCQQDIETYLARSWLSFQQPSGVHSITEDGARFGQPAQETQIYAFWAASSNMSAWLPVQATS